MRYYEDAQKSVEKGKVKSRLNRVCYINFNVFKCSFVYLDTRYLCAARRVATWMTPTPAVVRTSS
jgi:hypothetical protein